MSVSKIVAAAASGVGGAGLDVDEVFSCHLHTGTGSAQTITNGIDLSGEGGLTWIKGRMDGGFSHYLFDTERGVTKYIRSNETNEEQTDSNTLTAFNSNGFTVGSANATNYNTGDFVSWTWRKAPKFFDIVTYTGNATNRTISHSLGSVPGMILVKDLSGTGAWAVYHRSVGNGAGQNYVLNLSTTAGDASGVWNGTAPTSSVFSVGTDGTVNESGRNFVAYLFAHNDNDGGFGAAEDQDIIKCGHFDTNSSEEATIDLGFEPQWVFYKRYNGSSEGDWLIYDAMRGMQGDFLSQAALLEANTSDAEDATTNRIAVTSTGFKVDNWGTASVPFIYMAIRRGPLAVPDDATKVFGMQSYTSGGDGPVTGFVTDFSLLRKVGTSYNWYATARLTGTKNMYTNATDAEATNSNAISDRMDGMWNTVVPNHFIWGWKRAPGYFDVVTYTGTGSNRTVAHNLGVAPEMMWIKARISGGYDWMVYHKDIPSPNSKMLKLNENGVGIDRTALLNNTAPDATQFTVGTDALTNNNTTPYIAYLFATVAGVSKMGTYTGNATSDRVIDCGFSNGARFVLIKDTSQNGTNWQVFDTARGITSTKAELLRLNLNFAQQPNGSPSETHDNLIEPDSSGFKLNHTDALQVNASGINYIFYAIA